ncbi:unnamed protein product [Lactuca saligna]|uniref:Uncharacterized protein n=1 Tax=Lactuca saligna TaxID=75948 RepID=A0AA35ZPT8_LACSI|nr:unnamed protein product [Lactuca saligna]
MKATVLCNIDCFKPTSAMGVEASTTAVIIFCLQSSSCSSTSKDILRKGGGQNRHTRDTSVDMDGNIADLEKPPKAPPTKRGFGFCLFKKTTENIRSGAAVDVIQRISVSICSLVTKKLEENGGELPSSENSIKEDLSSLTIHLFLYIKESHGIEKAFQFLSNIHKLRVESGEEDARVLHHVEGASDC